MEPTPEKTAFVPRQAVPDDMFQAGDVVGHYKVEKVLGKGGMGVVYLVQHTALKKRFALKALPVELAKQGTFVSRFNKEAVMLGKLKHPHVVNVTDFGEFQGKLYLVLDYVDGGSLEEWFEKSRKPNGGAPPEEVYRIMLQILQGLAHAHKAGVIHRDIKPANIMLEKSGEAKISDFGLGRMAAEEEYRRTGGSATPFKGDSVTTTGTIVGTIDFMSPEARYGQPSDERSDVYALGVMTYYLLTGKKPHGLAQPASRLVPRLDPRWDKFIGNCLAEDKTQRYQSAGAALQALEVMHPSTQSRKMMRWLVPVVAAGFIIVGAGVWRSRNAPAPVVRAAVPADPTRLEGRVEAEKPEARPAAVEAPVLRKFALTGLPAGALVNYREHRYAANTTGRVILSLSPGPQVVRVTAPGYQDWEGEIGAADNDKEGTVPLELVPPHTVRFTGLPAKAQVKIGEQTVTADGSGTALAELRPGRVALVAAAPRFLPLELTVDVLQATESVSLEMKREPPSPTVVMKLSKDVAIKFRWVPPGEFYVGSPPDQPGHQNNDLPRAKVEISKGFYMAETEMTQRQHKLITSRNPSLSRALGKEDVLPVEQVGWRDLTGPGGVLERVNEELHRLELPYKADLPTEMEWEYACRSGTDSAFNDGSELTSDRDDPALNALAYYARGSIHDAPSPVAKFKPNAWGLYDMHGNVTEWAYGARGTREAVVRGGNYKVGPIHCRSASRIELTPETRATDTMGYRLVLHPIEQ